MLGRGRMGITFIGPYKYSMVGLSQTDLETWNKPKTRYLSMLSPTSPLLGLLGELVGI